MREDVKKLIEDLSKVSSNDTVKKACQDILDFLKKDRLREADIVNYFIEQINILNADAC